MEDLESTRVEGLDNQPLAYLLCVNYSHHQVDKFLRPRVSAAVRCFAQLCLHKISGFLELTASRITLDGIDHLPEEGDVGGVPFLFREVRMGIVSHIECTDGVIIHLKDHILILLTQ